MSEATTAINLSDIYCAVKPCGCVEALMSQSMPAKDLAKEIGKLVRRGYAVQLLPREEAISRLGRCKCGKAGK